MKNLYILFTLLLVGASFTQAIEQAPGSTTEEDAPQYHSDILVDSGSSEEEKNGDQENQAAEASQNENSEEESSEHSSAQEADEDKEEEIEADEQKSATSEEEVVGDEDEDDDIDEDFEAEEEGDICSNCGLEGNKKCDDCKKLSDAEVREILGDDDSKPEEIVRDTSKTITVKRKVCVLHRWIYKRCRKVAEKRIDPKVCVKVGEHRTKKCDKWKIVQEKPPKVRVRRCTARTQICTQKRKECRKWRVTHTEKKVCVRCCTCKGNDPHACSCVGSKNGMKCKHGKLNVPYQHQQAGIKSDFRQSVQRALDGKKYKNLNYKWIPLRRHCIDWKTIPAKRLCKKYKNICVSKKTKCIKRGWLWVIRKFDENGKPYIPRRKRVCANYKITTRKYCQKYKNGAERIIYLTKCHKLKKPRHVCLKYGWKFWKVDPIAKECPCILKEKYGIHSGLQPVQPPRKK